MVSPRNRMAVVLQSASSKGFAPAFLCSPFWNKLHIHQQVTAGAPLSHEVLKQTKELADIVSVGPTVNKT